MRVDCAILDAGASQIIVWRVNPQCMSMSIVSSCSSVCARVVRVVEVVAPD